MNSGLLFQTCTCLLHFVLVVHLVFSGVVTEWPEAKKNFVVMAGMCTCFIYIVELC